MDGMRMLDENVEGDVGVHDLVGEVLAVRQGFSVAVNCGVHLKYISLLQLVCDLFIVILH